MRIIPVGWLFQMWKWVVPIRIRLNAQPKSEVQHQKRFPAFVRAIIATRPQTWKQMWPSLCLLLHSCCFSAWAYSNKDIAIPYTWIENIFTLFRQHIYMRTNARSNQTIYTICKCTLCILIFFITNNVQCLPIQYEFELIKSLMSMFIPWLGSFFTSAFICRDHPTSQDHHRKRKCHVAPNQRQMTKKALRSKQLNWIQKKKIEKA